MIIIVYIDHNFVNIQHIMIFFILMIV